MTIIIVIVPYYYVNYGQMMVITEIRFLFLQFGKWRLP